MSKSRRHDPITGAGMRRGLCALALLLAGAGEVLAARGPLAVRADGERSAQPGVVVVKLRDRLAAGPRKSTGVAGIDAVLVRHGIQDLLPVQRGTKGPRKTGRTDLSRIYELRYAGSAPPEVVAAELAARPEIEYAEPLWLHRLDATPNDPSFPSQAGYLNRMRVPQAWDHAKAEGSLVVAIADGGTDWRHPDLQANIWSNPGEIAGNSIDDDGNGYVDDVRGWNFANETNDPTGLPATPNNAYHGTHTAGIACAVTNNGNGVAGTSWNARLMPICISTENSDNVVAYGFQGILYAADNGADVVNCSWGSLGSASQFELEVVTYAWEQGTCVVAAAGNNSSSQAHYPSGYPHVLSVANVNNVDVKANTSNWGTTVDLCAQGQSILSTVPGSFYDVLSGTSMSSPQVAGICTLVKKRWPGYTPDQVMERVRVTADDIDSVNPSRRGLLGKGRVNAEAALTKNTPSVRITQATVTDTDDDGVIEPGETVTLALQVTNYLAAASGLTFKLRETSQHASPTDSVATLANLDSLASAVLTPLTFTVAPTAPIQHPIQLILAIDGTAPLYTDRDRLSVTVLPTFVTHDVSNVITSVTSVGKIGYSVAIGGTGSDGVGFKYKESPNLLFEGALLIGIGAGQISDAARGTNASLSDEDFLTVGGGTPRISEPGPWAQEQTVASFNDAIAETPLPVVVRQDSYAYTAPEHDDYVILRYWIRNSGAAALNGLRVGWYCDWDVDGSSFVTNRTGYDAARELSYIYDTGPGPDVYVGTSVLNAAGATSVRGIVNDQAAAPDWGLYDGYTNDEKWQSLAGGIVHPEVGPEDISNVIATGPFTVAPGDSVEVGFAFVGGDDLPALQANAEAAALKWVHLHSGTPVEIYDLTAAQDGADVLVRWRTQSERDVAAFRVFRARPGEGFAALVPDLAPNDRRAYEFRDRAPGDGMWLYRIGEVAGDGSVQLHGSTGIHVAANLPTRTFLDPAVPNPFNPRTTLRFGIPHAGPVVVDVFDARGRHVRRLLEERHAAPGFRQVVWDGSDDAGVTVASGVYSVRLRASGTTATRRVTLVK